MEAVQICGIKVYPFENRDTLIDYAFGRKGMLVAVNAEKSINADNTLRGIINENIGYCDGAGIVKGCRRKGVKKAIRIPGCELWLDIISRYAPQGKSFYLVGSRQEVVEGTVAKLRQQYPGINIAGYRNGFIKSAQERDELIDDIARTAPDIIFVAMGSPRQGVRKSLWRKYRNVTKRYTRGWAGHSTFLWALSNAHPGSCSKWGANGYGGLWHNPHAYDASRHI